MDDYIFISYSRMDEVKVREIYTQLIKMGYNCWLDVDQIQSGSDWNGELQKAIEDCSHFVVICTPSSMSSKNVLAEWQYAFELKKPIHPIIVKSCIIPFRLRIYQHVDATKLGFEETARQLVQGLPARKTIVPDVSKNVDSGVSKIQGLIARAVQNWHSFGLLLDQSAFSYVDGSRDDIKDLDAATAEFLYLSARKLKYQNKDSMYYWATHVKQHSSAIDSVENVIIDQINEASLYDSQVELELFASAHLISKIIQLITLSADISQISLLLDAANRILTRPQHRKYDFVELENLLYRKFSLQPDSIFARALGWIESPRMLKDIQTELAQSQPKHLGEIDKFHLICLANMQNQEVVSILKQFTPNGFVFIPAGWFLMGDNAREDHLAYPEHEVFVPGFWLRKVPVTMQEFQAHQLFQLEKIMEDIPVHNINWTSAKNWINRVAWEIKVPLALPTEAMWEKAASWNPELNKKYRYPWGDEPDKSRCNTIESDGEEFTPVGAFNPEGSSPYGILDMAGNVWEWTSSPWKVYPYQPRFERNPGSEKSRILRGLSKDDREGLQRFNATRIAFDEDYAFKDAGMRVAIVVDI